MILMTVFAGAALLLAMVGLYGVMSYQVTQRTREIGVRMALGASRSQVLRMVVSRSAVLTSLGVGLGIAGSFGLTRFVRTLLFGVSPTSPWIFVAVAGALFVVAVFACFVPAVRAVRVDPLIALRSE
jgi:ABC-type antimicrobial peptide transport system permease subunit